MNNIIDVILKLIQDILSKFNEAGAVDIISVFRDAIASLGNGKE